MINNIGSSTGYSAMTIGSSGGPRGTQRPDPSKMAEDLFSKLDTQNKGYVEKSDLQSAFDKLSTSGNSDSSASVDDVFSQMDSDGDGKVTKDEMSSSLQKLADQLDSQFNTMRTQNGMAGAGGMPPPPPPQGGNDAGFTKDELSSMAQEIGSTDSKRASLVNNLVQNFDKADTDGDGKVSAKEAMAYDQQTKSSSSTTSASGTASSSGSGNTEANVMMRIMQLMQAYGFGQDGSQSGASGTLSLSA